MMYKCALLRRELGPVVPLDITDIKYRKKNGTEGNKMAIYHCNVKIIGRNSGRSVVAAAAYRAGEKLANQYDGLVHDYRKKNWIIYREILLPNQAPKEYQDRETLWNAVEKTENSRDAQLAREVEVALPLELTRDAQVELIKNYVYNNFVSKGMCADIAIHDPPVVNDRHQPIDVKGEVTTDIKMMQFRNPHAHILLSIRPIDSQGKWESKSKIEYLCKKEGEEKAFTADEFREAKIEGWEKQYRYWRGKQKIWMTRTEGEEQGLRKINNTPKTTPFGRKNLKCEYWNRKECIFEWRQNWEDEVNAALRTIGRSERINSRSYQMQGLSEKIPTLHLGVGGANIAKRAAREQQERIPEKLIRHSDLAEINKLIENHNHLADLTNEIFNLIEKQIYTLCTKAEHCEKLEDMSECLEQKKNQYFQYQKVYDETLQRIKVTSKNIEQYQKELNECGIFMIKDKNRIQAIIREKQSKLDHLEEYLSYIRRKYEITQEDDAQRLESEIEEIQKQFNDLTQGLNELENSVQKLEGLCREKENAIHGILNINSEKRCSDEQNDKLEEENRRSLGKGR